MGEMLRTQVTEVEVRHRGLGDQVFAQALDGGELDGLHAERSRGLDVDELVVEEERLFGLGAEFIRAWR